MVNKAKEKSDLPYDDYDIFEADHADLKPLKHAGEFWLFGVSGGPCSFPTVHRYANEGCHGVVLKTIITSRSTLTTEAACKEFTRNVDAVRRRKKQVAGVTQTSDEKLREMGLK